MMNRDLLITALAATGEGGTPAHDADIATRVAEDCLAIFTLEMTEVSRQIRRATATSPQPRSEHGEDLRYDQIARPRLRLGDDDMVRVDAVRQQSHWYGPLGDDQI
ncbi:MAG TPA: hypothetical protein VES01_10435 [Dermatophilaceae bacterium]|nr:hypothetical protein [Dermatophilaceae bacterium]